MQCSTLRPRHPDPKYPHKVATRLPLSVRHAFTIFSGFGSNSSGADSYMAPASGAAPSAAYSAQSAPGTGKYAGFGNPEFQGKDRSGSIDISSIQDGAAKAMSFMADGLSKLKGKIDETAKQNASPTVGSSSLYQNPGTQVSPLPASPQPCLLTCSCSQLLAPSLPAAVAPPHTMWAELIEAARATPLLPRHSAPRKAPMAAPRWPAAALRLSPAANTRAKSWRRPRSPPACEPCPPGYLF